MSAIRPMPGKPDALLAGEGRLVVDLHYGQRGGLTLV
jgi:hypothetical protein